MTGENYFVSNWQARNDSGLAIYNSNKYKDFNKCERQFSDDAEGKYNMKYRHHVK